MSDDYINDSEIIAKALAFTIKAIDGLPKLQWQDREFRKRVDGVLRIATKYDEERRKALLEEAERRLNGQMPK